MIIQVAKQSPLQRDDSSHSDSGSVEVETLMKQVEELTKVLLSQLVIILFRN